MYLNEYEGKDCVGQWGLERARSGTWGYCLYNAETGRRALVAEDSVAEAAVTLLRFHSHLETHPDELEKLKQSYLAFAAVRDWQSLPFYKRLWYWAVSAW